MSMLHSQHIRRWGAVALVAAALLGGTGSAAAAPSAVSIADGPQIAAYQFSPDTFQVSVGDTVTWTNTGDQPHTITAADGSFDSGLIAPGQSFSFAFQAPGAYTYACAPHPWMKGTVTVI